jgi:hypothetical protein
MPSGLRRFPQSGQSISSPSDATADKPISALQTRTTCSFNVEAREITAICFL